MSSPIQPVGSTRVGSLQQDQLPPSSTGPYNPTAPSGQIVSAPPRALLASMPIIAGQDPRMGLAQPRVTVRNSAPQTAAPAGAPLPINVISSKPYPELGVSVQTLANGLNAVWSMAYAPNGDVYFTEKPGRVRLIRDGVVQPNPVASMTVGGGEGGLLGMALDPNFAQNRYAYLYYTAQGNRENRVVRVQLSEDGTSAGPETVLVSGIPAAGNHNGGRIAFGPDGKLYISIGDAGRGQNAQSLSSLSGKILRVNTDGSAPADNPFVGQADADPRIWSYGHRNPQGMGWNDRGVMVASEFGASSHDEINLIRPGQNYGWPVVEGDAHRPPFTAPLAHAGRNPSWAPSGSTFLNGNSIPGWRGNYFMSMLGFSAGAARGVMRFTIDENDVVRSQQPMFRDDFGRVRSVSEGPDGYLYITTSNYDGRGPRLPEGDRILRVVPLEAAR